MDTYTPHRNYAPHQAEFLRCRAEAVNRTGLDAARDLIRQCRLVRCGRQFELQAVEQLKATASEVRKQAALPEPEPLTVAEQAVLGQSPDAVALAA